MKIFRIIIFSTDVDLYFAVSNASYLQSKFLNLNANYYYYYYYFYYGQSLLSFTF